MKNISTKLNTVIGILVFTGSALAFAEGYQGGGQEGNGGSSRGDSKIHTKENPTREADHSRDASSRESGGKQTERGAEGTRSARGAEGN